MTLVYVLLALWLTWVFGHLAAMLLIKPDIAHCNGFTVHIPAWVASSLEVDEVRAVYQHELGHLYKLHVWKNFMLVCVFMRASKQRRYRQELEADDYAYDQGFGPAMVSALRKLSYNPYDNIRARRLELKGLRDAGDPHRTGGATIRTGEVK